jgi:hypothetical protein
MSTFLVMREHRTEDGGIVRIATDHETAADAVWCLAEYIVYHREFLGSSGMVHHA